jgi:hypothetical protein
MHQLSNKLHCTMHHSLRSLHLSVSVAVVLRRFLVQQACEATNARDCPSQQWLWTVVFGVLQVMPSCANM